MRRNFAGVVVAADGAVAWRMSGGEKEGDF